MKLLSACLLFHLLVTSSAIKWLAVGRQNGPLRRSDCRRLKRETIFTKDQSRMCTENADIIPVLKHSSETVIKSCKTLFGRNRWNCSSIEKLPKLSRDLTIGSKEQAFVHAFSTASLIQIIAQACASGSISSCSCGTPIRKRKELEPDKRARDAMSTENRHAFIGCGHNLRFATKFARNFADVPWDKRLRKTTRRPTKNLRLNKRSLTNLHNNRVGRQVANKLVQEKCRCHGTSGSCTAKSCWRIVPSLEKIGKHIQVLYGESIQVRAKFNKKKEKRVLIKVTNPFKKAPINKNVKPDQLVFYTISPDYCKADERFETPGTTGRTCEEVGDGSCESLCCGRGYTTESIKVVERCDCKYYWCCYIKCSKCTKLIEVHQCR
ncbi:DgyrCDS12747 [Dimorphilus gyrociliatus]|uniref:Protein Wnt n=1 Tax=Dimorphilus gyrociliatus TaxID=2664684 RepID=A0A7I8W8F9_9ANNE|nr:DgyrCDS12747 [Dimorphilus gyrociliatus]